MLELINQLDGFDPRGNIKVLMATNRCERGREGGREGGREREKGGGRRGGGRE